MSLHPITVTTAQHSDKSVQRPALQGCRVVLLAILACPLTACCPGCKSAKDELFEAIKTGDTRKVDELLSNRLDPNVWTDDWFGRTPLLVAIDQGRPDIVQLLLSRGADANMRNRRGPFFPLWVAAQRGDEQIVHLLVANGADVNLRWANLRSALHEASSFGHKGAIRLLIAEGADVNARSECGWTPLHDLALTGDYEDAAAMLIAAGADVNAINNWGETPLHTASAEGHINVAKLLIANGADVNAKNDRGASPLDAAMSSGREELADLLRKHGGQELRKPERRSACVPKAVRQQQTQPAREDHGGDGVE